MSTLLAPDVATENGPEDRDEAVKRLFPCYFYNHVKCHADRYGAVHGWIGCLCKDRTPPWQGDHYAWIENVHEGFKKDSNKWSHNQKHYGIARAFKITSMVLNLEIENLQRVWQQQRVFWASRCLPKIFGGIYDTVFDIILKILGEPVTFTTVFLEPQRVLSLSRSGIHSVPYSLKIAKQPCADAIEIACENMWPSHLRSALDITKKEKLFYKSIEEHFHRRDRL